MKRVILINLVILLVLIGGGSGLFYYFYENKYFITTDNAMVQGDIITLASPANGSLTAWNVKEGEAYTAGQSLGSIGTTDAKTLSAPVQGSVIASSVVQGQNVTQGQTLAKFVDLGKLYVVANIDENDINDVAVGKDVDLTFDAFPNMTFKGSVEQIGLATSASFSFLPAAGAAGSFTKVTQNIPVKISLINPAKGIIPGLNVTVKIHK